LEEEEPKSDNNQMLREMHSKNELGNKKQEGENSEVANDPLHTESNQGLNEQN